MIPSTQISKKSEYSAEFTELDGTNVTLCMEVQKRSCRGSSHVSYFLYYSNVIVAPFRQQSQNDPVSLQTILEKNPGK